MFSNEPVRYISVALGIVLLALPHLSKFGVPITPEQTDALMTFLPGVLAMLGGEAIRTYVTPVSKLPVQKGQ